MSIKKLRIYIETSVFNHYLDVNRDGHADTVRLFESIKAGDYEGYTSEYAANELSKAPEPKRGKMLALIEKYHLTSFDIEEESDRLADLYLESGVIPIRYRIDAAHIAIASIYGLDCVVSYNFEHINRVRTKLLTERINVRAGYGGVIICTARELWEDE